MAGCFLRALIDYHARMTSTIPAYEELITRFRDYRLLQSTASLLSWDQETLMPTGGLAYRGRQLAHLARLKHEALTDAHIGTLLSECESHSNGDDSDFAVNVREIRRTYDRATKLPADLVVEISQTTTQAKHEWAQARKANDFSRFEPWLDKVVQLNIRRADCFGYPDDGEPWDALADEYDAGCTAALIESVFTPLRERLVVLLGELMGSGKAPSNAFNELELSVDQQRSFVRFIADAIGFDFNRGRLDESTHPFCSGTHCHDVRMTTRFHEDMLPDALGSTMHECGHGIYSQGLLDGDYIDTPAGMSVSLSIHESQSRTWENQVGRSVAFWKWCYPKLSVFFGEAVNGLSCDQVYGGVNIVKPSLIRVEADEVTYNLHIMVRFELERALMKGDIKAVDVPGAWNEKYRDYLGIDVPDDARGCLQDIHWSMGAMGYFPTYTLGNLYAAQFFEQAVANIPDLEQQFTRGEFASLKKWLNENIHEQGMRYLSEPLCEKITGKPLSADALMRHLESKFRPIYGL